MEEFKPKTIEIKPEFVAKLTKVGDQRGIVLPKKFEKDWNMIQGRKYKVMIVGEAEKAKKSLFRSYDSVHINSIQNDQGIGVDTCINRFSYVVQKSGTNLNLKTYINNMCNKVKLNVN